MTTITLNLKLLSPQLFRPCNRLDQGLLSVIKSAKSLFHYLPTDRLYDTETGSECSAYVTTSCWSGGTMTIQNAEEELLELGTPSAGESGTEQASADRYRHVSRFSPSTIFFF